MPWGSPQNNCKYSIANDSNFATKLFFAIGRSKQLSVLKLIGSNAITKINKNPKYLKNIKN
ncbi:hypothetical protein [Candidatus Uabimicrobium sp. HlEnr_7]|uniref:hypothetical protein n=1 Tax=Candidatus Uabimicrobium helgolandensis TaxID=3095367 RepID=UPI0035563479